MKIFGRYIVVLLFLVFVGFVGPSLLSAQDDASVLGFIAVSLAIGFFALVTAVRIYNNLRKEKHSEK